MRDSEFLRKNIILATMIVGLLVLIVQAARLQIFDDSYKRQARRTTVFKKVMEPARGIFYDRNGQVLTYNHPLYDLMCTRNLVDEEMDTELFCALLDIDFETFSNNLNQNFGSRFYSRNLPFTFLKNVDAKSIASFREHMSDFPGFDIRLRSQREYPKACGPNVIGYVSEVSRDEIDASGGSLAPGDLIGSRGMEKQYDQSIRGNNGISYVMRDNRGQEVGAYQEGLLDSNAIAGFDIQTAIDIDLQAFGESLLQNKNGSIVAIEPQTGEVLALISSPTFDPNILSVFNNRGATFDSLARDPNKPFLDRSVSAQYPPGSIFKTVVSLIALQEGILYPGKSMSCTGAYTAFDQTWGCRNHPHPSNMARALQYSCNTYYYQVYRSIIEKYGFNKPDEGLAMMNSYLGRFGLGSKLDIDQPFEKNGNIPTARYYDRQYGSNRWKSTGIISNGIGQGEIELTTIQMANLAAIIANKGYYYAPHIIKSYRNSSKQIDKKYSTRKYVGIDSIHFDAVQKGMILAAENLAIPNVRAAGKTGTSQNIGEDHSVFFAYAPVDDPKIAISVYVENAGAGAAIARPIASYLLEYYLNGSIAEYRKPQMKYIQSIKTSITPEETTDTDL